MGTAIKAPQHAESVAPLLSGVLMAPLSGRKDRDVFGCWRDCFAS